MSAVLEPQGLAGHDHSHDHGHIHTPYPHAEHPLGPKTLYKPRPKSEENPSD